MAYDDGIRKLVLFGGKAWSGSGYRTFNDTWTYDGKTWTEESPGTSPPARQGAAMAYDPAMGKIILFGGSDVLNDRPYGHGFNDTWTYDGKTWTEESPGTSPPARQGAAMAYDPAIGKIILFGGLVTQPSYPNLVLFNDTWTYNGSHWTKESPSTSPGERSDAAITYDASLGKILLFGGSYGGYEINDTWTYDGTTWTTQSECGYLPHACATGPRGRYGASMAYYPAVGRTVLFGGQTYGREEPPLLNDTWIYDGRTWTSQSALAAPTPRAYGSMGYNPASKTLILFGGRSLSEDNNDTWIYGP